MGEINLEDIREEIKEEKVDYIERIIKKFIMKNYAQAS